MMMNRFLPLAIFLIYCLIFPACESTPENTAPATAVDGGLVEIAALSGLDVIHEPAVDSSYFMPEIIGPGVTVFDYDNDGDLDIYLVNGQFRNPQNDAPPVQNRLFRQEADGRFTDVTAASGLGDEGYGMGAAAGDIDNDGDLDLYVSNYEADALYENNGDGTFRNISTAAGISNKRWACSVAFMDIDLDNYLDIYITNYLDFDPCVICTFRDGRPEYCAPSAHKGVADVLYRNNGDGSFTDISVTSGIDAIIKKGLGVIATDVNEDGYPDIYVANDGEENLLWLNAKDGTFKESGLLMGVALNTMGNREAGMGLALGDVNNDLQFDIYVTHVENESNTLYMSQGESGFKDNSRQAGFEKTALLPFTGFGSGFADLDHDGNLDLVIGNGRINRGKAIRQSGRKYWEPYKESNLIFNGDGTGKFRNITSRFSEFSETVDISRGVALGDMDNDGDVDFLIANTGGPLRYYRNDMPKKGNSLLITAWDPALNRAAVGAVITLRSGDWESRHQVNPYYSYLGSNDFRVHVGIGEHEAVEAVIVKWPGGGTESFGPREANQHIVLEKGSGISAF